MNIKELIEDMRGGNWQQIAREVEGALRQAGWSESMEQTPTGTTYVTRNSQTGGIVFMVSVVNSNNGRDEHGQLSGKILNQVITPFYNKARSQGIIFTQPVGMANSGWNSDRANGSIIQFQIG